MSVSLCQLQKDTLQQDLKSMNRELLQMEIFECIVLHCADNEPAPGEEEEAMNLTKYP